MKMLCKIRTTGIAVAFAVLAGFATQPATTAEAQESTWDQIKTSGKIRMGVTEYPPYFVKNRDTGEWQGALVDMGRDIASVLNVEYEPVEIAGFEQAVLSIQSNKIDMFFGLNATPARITAIDFAGPIYWIRTIIVNGKNFNGQTWGDYNKPEVKIAVIRGGADAAVAARMAPQAERVELTDAAQIALAVSSGRADALVLTTLSGLVAKSKNPDLGTYVIPTPEVALPTYIGIRFEEDQRFQKFLDHWAEWNLLTAANDARMIGSLSLLGIEEIPEGLKFTP